MNSIKAIYLLTVLLITGCASVTPYVAARHLSDPSVSGDGYDLGCLGAKTRERLSLKAGWCKNVRGGDMIEAEIEYDLFER